MPRIPYRPWGDSSGEQGDDLAAAISSFEYGTDADIIYLTQDSVAASPAISDME